MCSWIGGVQKRDIDITFNQNKSPKQKNKTKREQKVPFFFKSAYLFWTTSPLDSFSCVSGHFFTREFKNTKTNIDQNKMRSAAKLCPWFCSKITPPASGRPRKSRAHPPSYCAKYDLGGTWHPAIVTELEHQTAFCWFLPPSSLFSFFGVFRVECPSVFLHLPFPISKKRPGQEARSTVPIKQIQGICF
jgi:hypothetical protein